MIALRRKKRDIAETLLERHLGDQDILISTQVLQEFYVTVTRKWKHPVAPADAANMVFAFADFPMVQIDPMLIQAAIHRSQVSKFSFWDGLIIQAALAGGASVLYSEDLHDGQGFDGMKVSNPFKPG